MSTELMHLYRCDVAPEHRFRQVITATMNAVNGSVNADVHMQHETIDQDIFPPKRKAKEPITGCIEVNLEDFPNGEINFWKLVKKSKKVEESNSADVPMDLTSSDPPKQEHQSESSRHGGGIYDKIIAKWSSLSSKTKEIDGGESGEDSGTDNDSQDYDLDDPIFDNSDLVETFTKRVRAGLESKRTHDSKIGFHVDTQNSLDGASDAENEDDEDDEDDEDEDVEDDGTEKDSGATKKQRRKTWFQFGDKNPMEVEEVKKMLEDLLERKDKYSTKNYIEDVVKLIRVAESHQCVSTFSIQFALPAHQHGKTLTVYGELESHHTFLASRLTDIQIKSQTIENRVRKTVQAHTSKDKHLEELVGFFKAAQHERMQNLQSAGGHLLTGIVRRMIDAMTRSCSVCQLSLCRAVPDSAQRSSLKREFLSVFREIVFCLNAMRNLPCRGAQGEMLQSIEFDILEAVKSNTKNIEDPSWRNVSATSLHALFRKLKLSQFTDRIYKVKNKAKWDENSSQTDDHNFSQHWQQHQRPQQVPSQMAIQQKLPHYGNVFDTLPND
eukprot:757285-Hanusia_phi.AAC.3